MNRQRLLRGVTLLLPVLLAWIVLLGEVNRGFDRSPRISMGATAEAIVGTSYSGPELKLSGELFEPRNVDAHRFPPGSDVLLRYRRRDRVWEFVGGRKPGAPIWTDSQVDVPARVERARYGGGISAAPLVPKEFAISERTVFRILRRARLNLVLRRGALGNVWVETATQTGESLGGIVAVLRDPRGGGPLLFGTAETRLDPRGFSMGTSSGWTARIADLAIVGATEIPERPIEAESLSDGRILLATVQAAGRGFEVTILAPDGKASGAPSHFEGSLQIVGVDGTLWIREGSNVDALRRPGVLVRRDLAGTVSSRVSFENPAGVFGAAGDFVATRDAASVARFRIVDGKSVETDRWILGEVLDARLTAADDLVAATSLGVFRLTPGVKDPVALFAAQNGQTFTRLLADAGGDLLIVSRPSQEVRGSGMVLNRTERVFFLPKGGSVVSLGEAKDSRVGYDWQEGSRFGSRRFLTQDGLLFYASGERILVFDLASRALKTQIVERPGAAPERIL